MNLMKNCLRVALVLLTLLCALPAWSATYTLPGTLQGCTSSGNNYSCPSVTLGNNDVVIVNNPLPANVTVNGTLDIGRSVVNGGGAAQDLNVSVTGSFTVGNSGQLNGSVSAASMTNPGGRADIGGSLTTTGNISLGNSARVAQCVRSSSGTISLANGTTVGGVCCGALGACTSACVINNSGGAMPALCTGGSPPPTPPARFNAFDTGTAAGIAGVIRTKEAGTQFTLAIVAVNSAGNGVATTFTGNVRVEVLDASNNAGALNSTTNCRASWTAASGTSATTLAFASSDAGRKNIALAVPNAFSDARIRITYPDTGTATATGCSTDNFAVKPANFNIVAYDATSSTSGTARQLSNNGTSGGVVHKAGWPFTLQATARNSSLATATFYTGTPTIAAVVACIGGACGGTLGALSATFGAASSGVASSSTATYSEAGAFAVTVTDTNFAAVDAADSSLAERTVTSTSAAIGRFVPDRFVITPSLSVTPQWQTFGTDNSTCSSRTFTYYGQPFGYAVRAEAVVSAVNRTGTVTTNFAVARMGSLNIDTYTYAAGAPGLDMTASSVLPPGLTSSAGGLATLRANASDRLTMARSPTTPTAALTPGITLTWAVSDTSENGVAGNGVINTQTPLPAIAIGFDTGTGQFRYGQLKLGSAYGSELIALAVPLETQYWDATTSSFVTNSADHCTTLPTSSVSLANFRGSLAACQTAPTTAVATVSGGRATMRLSPSGNGNKGSVDGTVHLGSTLAPAGAVRCAASPGITSAAVPANLPWLQSKAVGGTTFDQNPSARFSFGQYRSPLIQLREMY